MISGPILRAAGRVCNPFESKKSGPLEKLTKSLRVFDSSISCLYNIFRRRIQSGGFRHRASGGAPPAERGMFHEEASKTIHQPADSIPQPVSGAEHRPDGNDHHAAVLPAHGVSVHGPQPDELRPGAGPVPPGGGCALRPQRQRDPDGISGQHHLPGAGHRRHCGGRPGGDHPLQPRSLLCGDSVPGVSVSIRFERGEHPGGHRRRRL